MGWISNLPVAAAVAATALLSLGGLGCQTSPEPDDSASDALADKPDLRPEAVTPCTCDEECEDKNPCTTDTCLDGGCRHDAMPAGTVCRRAVGVCDVAETCSGAVCPPDTLAAAGAVCRRAAGPCDVAETCTGSSAACPQDAFASAGLTCRVASGPCDVAEACTGQSPACPQDAFASAGLTCRVASGPCDVAEACTGQSPACPQDAFASAGIPCRVASGPCDVAEACTGQSPACPQDAFASAGTICRVAADVCDVAETCSGKSPACPLDQAGNCDDDEDCPLHVRKPSNGRANKPVHPGTEPSSAENIDQPAFSPRGVSRGPRHHTLDRLPGDGKDGDRSDARATSVTFTILSGTCGGGGIELYVNGVLVGTASVEAACRCGEQPQVVTVTDPTVLELLDGKEDVFAVRRIDGEGEGKLALGFIKVDVAHEGVAEPASVCVYDAVSGGGCAPRDLCEGFDSEADFLYSFAGRMALKPVGAKP